MKKSLLISFILLIGVLTIGCSKKDKYKDVEIVKIEYSYSGGYGTVISIAKKTFTFYSDGKVVLSNAYDDSTYTFEIDKDSYNELSNFIKERMHIMDKKAHEDKNILDGSSSYLDVELADGAKKSFGGYMVKDKEFIQMRDKIYEYIDQDVLKEYIDNIGK